MRDTGCNFLMEKNNLVSAFLLVSLLSLDGIVSAAVDCCSHDRSQECGRWDYE